VKGDESDEKESVFKRLRGLTREGAVLLYRGIPVDYLEALPKSLAAALLCTSHTTLETEIQLSRIRQTPEGRIPRTEILRYLQARLPPLPKHPV